MFEQHPVPQQISSYQFRLVGDMTLKQFFQLAAGCVIALLVYGSPLPGIFKWPIIIISVIGGAAFAFLPLQDRPLAVWVVAFFRSIYGPTLYKWEKLPKYEYFTESTATQTGSALPDTGVTPTTKPTHPSDIAVANLDSKETSFLSKLTSLVNIPHTQIKSVSTTPVTSHDNQTQAVEEGFREPKPKTLENQPSAKMILDKTSIASLSGVTSSTNTNDKADLKVPTIEAISVKPATQTTQSMPLSTVAVEEKFDSSVVGMSSTIPGTTKKATFNPAVKPPSTPEYPNLLTGQVFDSTGKIIEGAIMEIKDSSGRAVRAFRSNQLGHFMTATPLPNGKYTISTEKPNLNFIPVEIDLSGSIVEPIAVWAENTK
jgi:hypothetical protein